VRVTARNGHLKISGDDDPVGMAAQVLERLMDAARRDEPMSRKQVIDVIATVTSLPHAAAVVVPGERKATPVVEDATLGMDVYLPGKRVKALTGGQRDYLQAIFDNDLTFCSGPAGTGKTYLAVAAAVAMLKRGRMRKLVLVRPAVEAGEKLGFLPGDLQEKVNPYLRPLLDALHDMMEFDQIQRFMACDLIEIVPLAFMRGRTLNDALIILDEAQNTTKGQMLMFLTRLGMGGKMIVTGDASQIDLEDPRESGLIDAVCRLRPVRGVGMVTLDGADIVRHSLVQRIVQAYGDGRGRLSGAPGAGLAPGGDPSDKISNAAAGGQVP
jgi:phosphate starvation-inducible PhoH-like protein